MWNKRDRFGRIVGRVLAAECERAACPYVIDVGLEQIKAGLAWHYKQYQKDQAPEERTRYATVETEARARHEGLWKEPDAVPPWAFRHPERRSRVTSLSPTNPRSSRKS